MTFFLFYHYLTNTIQIRYCLCKQTGPHKITVFFTSVIPNTFIRETVHSIKHQQTLILVCFQHYYTVCNRRMYLSTYIYLYTSHFLKVLLFRLELPYLKCLLTVKCFKTNNINKQLNKQCTMNLISEDSEFISEHYQD